VAATVHESVAYVFRFFQLLCENHNHECQLVLRKQGLVQLTMDFIDVLCPGVNSGLSLGNLFDSETKVALINQTLISLTEYCQGPCPENQMTLATYDSHAIDICMALLLHDMSKVKIPQMEAVLDIKGNTTKFLLSLLESRYSIEVVDRIVYNVDNPTQVTKALKQLHGLAKTKSKIPREVIARAQEVGHDSYILSYQIGVYKPVFGKHMKEDEELNDYRDHTA